MSFCRQSASVLCKLFTAASSSSHNNHNNTLIKLITPRFTGECRTIKRWVAPTLKELKRRRDKVGPEPIQPRSTYLEWNYDAELYAFGKRLNEEFDRTLLARALTHRSYAITKQQQQEKSDENAKSTIIDDNLDLIKIGDALITKHLTNIYRKQYPDDVANAIVKHLISDDVLAHVATHLGLKDIVLTREFPMEQSTLSDTFKAIVAALSQSHEENDTQIAHRFIDDFLCSQLTGKDVYDEIWCPAKPYDYLVNLIDEHVEARLCNQSAVNTILANYQVGLYRSDRKLLGIGWGESIENAKDTAALNAIQRIYANYARK